MRLKEIMVSLPCCCAHAFPARAFPDMCFETCEAEGIQPSVFKPTAFSPKSSFLLVMSSCARRLCVTFPQHPATNKPHQSLSQSFAASSGSLIILTAVHQPLHSMSIPAEALSVTCWV